MGMLTLAAAIGISSLGRAQPVPGGGPHTRIALINLAQVFKGYQKVNSFANENKKLLEPFQDRAKKCQEQIEAWTKEMEKKELPEAKRIEAANARKSYERQLEDLGNEAKLLYTKKNEEQMLIVYKEVMESAHRLAQSQGFELVMHFNDVPSTMPEYWSPQNVVRKIQAGACIPMYIAPGMDITQSVVDFLNSPNRAVSNRPQG